MKKLGARITTVFDAVEHIAAMRAPTCRVQRPSDVSVWSPLSRQPMTADPRHQIAATNSACRAEAIPAIWCVSIWRIVTCPSD